MVEPVDVGQSVEGKPQVPKYARVHVGQNVERDEQIVEYYGRPAHEEYDHKADEHFYYLMNEKHINNNINHQQPHICSTNK